MSSFRAHPLYVPRALRDAVARTLRGRVLQIRRKREDAVVVVLELAPGLEVHLGLEEHGGAPTRSFAQGPLYAASVERGGIDLERAGAPAARAAAWSACRALAALDEPGLVKVRPPPVAPARSIVHLEPTAIDALVEQLLRDGPLRPGWSVGACRAAGAEVVVPMTEEGGRSIELRLGPPDEGALFRTPELAISHSSLASEEDRCDAAALVFELGMRLEPLLARVEIAPSRGRRWLARGPLDRPGTFQVSLNGPCEQRCSFCCLDELERRAPASDEAERWTSAVRDAGRRGARLLRVNGIEPLRAAFVPELLDVAEESGFTRAEIKSTARPLSDRALAQKLVAGRRLSLRVDVPLYGSSAALHDRITGAPGSFGEVMRAVENVRAAGEAELVLETVLVPENVSDLPSLRALAKRIGAHVSLHAAHPTGPHAARVYPKALVRFSELVRAAFPPDEEALGELAFGEVPLCVELAHQEATGARCLRVERLDRRGVPSGAWYEAQPIEFASDGGNTIATSPMTPCPHRERCWAARACPAAVYSMYADLVGTGELAPVERSRLARVAGDEIAARIDALAPR